MRRREEGASTHVVGKVVDVLVVTGRRGEGWIGSRLQAGRVVNTERERVEQRSSFARLLLFYVGLRERVTYVPRL